MIEGFFVFAFRLKLNCNYDMNSSQHEMEFSTMLSNKVLTCKQ